MNKIINSALQPVGGATEKKDRKKNVWLLLCVSLAIGVFLLLVGADYSSFGKDDAESPSDEIREYDEIAYEKELSEKIESLCSSVRGAGKVKVALTLDGSFKAIYAQNTSQSDSKREYLLIGNGSNEKALIIGYSPPEVLGVGIVCEGGGDPHVRAEIISLVCAFLDLPANKIYVATLKK